jgi:2-keto-3-deoxy-galactonokinase
MPREGIVGMGRVAVVKMGEYYQLTRCIMRGEEAKLIGLLREL